MLYLNTDQQQQCMTLLSQSETLYEHVENGHLCRCLHAQDLHGFCDHGAGVNLTVDAH